MIWITFPAFTDSVTGLSTEQGNRRQYHTFQKKWGGVVHTYVSPTFTTLATKDLRPNTFCIWQLLAKERQDNLRWHCCDGQHGGAVFGARERTLTLCQQLEASDAPAHPKTKRSTKLPERLNEWKPCFLATAGEKQNINAVIFPSLVTLLWFLLLKYVVTSNTVFRFEAGMSGSEVKLITYWYTWTLVENALFLFKYNCWNKLLLIPLFWLCAHFI